MVNIRKMRKSQGGPIQVIFKAVVVILVLIFVFYLFSSFFHGLKSALVGILKHETGKLIVREDVIYLKDLDKNILDFLNKLAGSTTIIPSQDKDCDTFYVTTRAGDIFISPYRGLTTVLPEKMISEMNIATTHYIEIVNEADGATLTYKPNRYKRKTEYKFILVDISSTVLKNPNTNKNVNYISPSFDLREPQVIVLSTQDLRSLKASTYSGVQDIAFVKIRNGNFITFIDEKNNKIYIVVNLKKTPIETRQPFKIVSDPQTGAKYIPGICSANPEAYLRYLLYRCNNKKLLFDNEVDSCRKHKGP